ncbi:hypothetical protein BsWGS_05023 [Bradybaena similaris]
MSANQCLRFVSHNVSTVSVGSSTISSYVYLVSERTSVCQLNHLLVLRRSPASARVYSQPNSPHPAHESPASPRVHSQPTSPQPAHGSTVSPQVPSQPTGPQPANESPASPRFCRPSSPSVCSCPYNSVLTDPPAATHHPTHNR